MSSLFRAYFEGVKEGRIYQTRIFPDLLYITFWQAQNDYHFWTIYDPFIL
jgi:hypothetical protein